MPGEIGEELASGHSPRQAKGVADSEAGNPSQDSCETLKAQILIFQLTPVVDHSWMKIERWMMSSFKLWFWTDTILRFKFAA